VRGAHIELAAGGAIARRVGCENQETPHHCVVACANDLPVGMMAAGSETRSVRGLRLRLKILRREGTDWALPSITGKRGATLLGFSDIPPLAPAPKSLNSTAYAGPHVRLS
jgi:hypothetical protein